VKANQKYKKIAEGAISLFARKLLFVVEKRMIDFSRMYSVESGISFGKILNFRNNIRLIC
jgi:hypothetical protein